MIKTHCLTGRQVHCDVGGRRESATRIWQREPGHQWFYEFCDVSDDTSCEKEFKLTNHRSEDYKGTRFYNGGRTLVVKWYLNRVEEDVSGL